MAITGPFTKTFVSTSTRWKRSTSYRQTRPFRSRLPYQMRDQTVRSRSGSFPVVQGSDTTYQSGVAFLADNEAYNLAYAKFKDDLSESASWAVTLAERQQAVDMIVKRFSQLTNFVKAIRKGRIGDAAKALGLVQDKRVKKIADKHRRKRAFADTYLEFHFGWSPMMSDIYASLEVLAGQFNPFMLRGRGRASATAQTSTATYATGRVNTKCQILADYTISNPNVLMWSQLGLTNPAAVLFELVPFSFVLDWFVNVEQFLSHFTDFQGVSLGNISITYSRSIQEEAYYRATVSSPVSGRLSRGWYWLDRTTPASLPGPTLQVRTWKGFSVRRGLAAASLFLQNLPRS